MAKNAEKDRAAEILEYCGMTTELSQEDQKEFDRGKTKTQLLKTREPYDKPYESKTRGSLYFK